MTAESREKLMRWKRIHLPAKNIFYCNKKGGKCIKQGSTYFGTYKILYGKRAFFAAFLI